jgi:capsular polysaccharide export protein
MIKIMDLAGSVHRNILLLQGPVGPFFRYLASDLHRQGSNVFKVNFNGGDWLFYPKKAVNYRAPLNEWPDFCEKFIKKNKIDLVLLFGDCRPIHKQAHTVATALGIEVGVFEEGYVRPDYITLERYGVNGNSPLLKKTRDLIDQQTNEPPHSKPVPSPFWHAMVWGMLYNTTGTIMSPLFREYNHHRNLHIFDGINWLRSFFRKALFHIKEKEIADRISNQLPGKFFLVPLQVNNDAQIKEHSPFCNNQELIHEVMMSFGENAPADAFLVIKQHPLDRGYNNYGPKIKKLADALGIQNRVLYIHDFHLPILLSMARGVVVINSTVGLSALHHGCPLIALGHAIYSRPGLTYQGTLAEFWNNPETPSMEKYSAFIRYLKQSTQINGNYYRRLPLTGYRSGLAWQ